MKHQIVPKLRGNKNYCRDEYADLKALRLAKKKEKLAATVSLQEAKHILNRGF